MYSTHFLLIYLERNKLSIIITLELELGKKGRWEGIILQSIKYIIKRVFKNTCNSLASVDKYLKQNKTYTLKRPLIYRKNILNIKFKIWTLDIKFETDQIERASMGPKRPIILIWKWRSEILINILTTNLSSH